MGDFNICGNIGELLQQQIRIRNLLNMMRFNQDNCNNVDCVTEDIQFPRSDESFDIMSFMFLLALMFGALFTLIKPNLIKNKEKGIQKGDRDDDNDDNSRPVPPVN